MLNLNGQHAHVDPGNSAKCKSASALRSSWAALPWTGEIDAKTTRDLALLAALSSFLRSVQSPPSA
jgi:hypothetical protein